MKISTVRIRNKRTGKERVVNATDYLAIQHSSGAWELVSEQFVNKTEVPATVIIEPEKKVETTVASDPDLFGTGEEASEESDNEEVEIEIEGASEEESGEAETDASEEVKPKRRGRRSKSDD
jgi:hypothetical protein